MPPLADLRVALAAAAIAAIASGCAHAPAARVAPELFAVVPAADGHVGTIVVQREGSTHTLNSAYGAARVLPDGRTEETRLDAAQVQATFGATLAALPGRPASFTLYFLEGRDELTPESRTELEKVFSELKRRALPDIVVIGHTDRVGAMAYNDRLSLARAEKLRDMLVSLGLPAARIQAAGRGEREPLVPTEDNVPEPRNRRVEINVR